MNQFYLQSSGVDAYGEINIIFNLIRGYSSIQSPARQSIPPWENISITPIEGIEGADLNTLLQGFIILFGKDSISDGDLPGGVKAWCQIVPPSFATLFRMCPYIAILKRISIVGRCFLQSRINSCFFLINDNFVQTIESDFLSHYKLSEYFYGLLVMLFYWIDTHYTYIPDEFLIQLQIVLRQWKNYIKLFNSALFQGLDLDDDKSTYNLKFKITIQLDKIWKLLSIIIKKNISNSFTYKDDCDLMKASRFFSLSVTETEWIDPNYESSEGNSAQTLEQLKSLFKKKPNPTTNFNEPSISNIQIFGGENLFDTDDDDDIMLHEDDSEINSSINISESNYLQSKKQLPVQVPSQFDFLTTPLSLIPNLLIEELNSTEMNKDTSSNLKMINPTEIARQWTLSDYSLYSNIDLKQIYSVCFIENSSNPTKNTTNLNLDFSTKAAINHASSVLTSMSLNSLNNNTKKLNDNIKFNDSINLSSLRRLINRFNSSSLWISSSILTLNTPELRGKLISKFIQIANELKKLRNYHGLMSILTALQQGCIARLKVSFSYVSNSLMNDFNQLKLLMSGRKNYSEYKKMLINELNQDLYDRIPDKNTLYYNESSIKFNGFNEKDIENLKHSSGLGGLNWVADINERYNNDISTFMPSSPFIHTNFSSQFKNENQSNIFEDYLISNNIIINKNESPDFDNGIIPHSAAHISSLVTLNEAHPNYLTDFNHLFNLTKWKLAYNSIHTFSLIKNLQYNLAPVRTIVAALHITWKRHYTVDNESEIARKMYELSEQLESHNMIEDYLASENVQNEEDYENPSNSQQILNQSEISDLQYDDNLDYYSNDSFNGPETKKISVITKVFSLFRKKKTSSSIISDDDNNYNHRNNENESNKVNYSEDYEVEDNRDSYNSHTSIKKKKGSSLKRALSLSK